MVASFMLACCIATEEPVKSYTREEDIIYSRKDGMALTLDAFRPSKDPNRAAVFLIVSSGWGSSHSAINVDWVDHYTKRGYTVFAVVHSSAPRYMIPELIPDVHRAVRFVRKNASRFGVDPNRFAATGASAGAHLSLVLGTMGKPGDPASKDPVDRESSAVQAVACFFPPTDFNNFVGPAVNALDESVLKNYRKVIGAIPENIEERDALGRSISPIYWITATSAPSLLFHGSKDPYVLLHQSSSFVIKLQSAGVDAKLVVKEGESHGWKDMGKDVETCVDWFDAHLQSPK
ncbi:MAG: alpha/beta hydrolase [Chthonomonas sp.]|nr:alpha/beta hydrolase [Chthonomonas sp.]